MFLQGDGRVWGGRVSGRGGGVFGWVGFLFNLSPRNTKGRRCTFYWNAFLLTSMFKTFGYNKLSVVKRRSTVDSRTKTFNLVSWIQGKISACSAALVHAKLTRSAKF